MGSRYEWALFLHLVGAVLFFAGGAVAAVAFEAARRRELPDEIARLLGLTRVGVLLVAVGTVLLVAFGAWLVDLGNWGWGGWVAAALVLLGLSVLAGRAGGQWPKRARRLASELAAGGREATPELRRLLDHPLSATLNYGSAALALVILGLMVFKPGE